MDTMDHIIQYLIPLNPTEAQAVGILAILETPAQEEALLAHLKQLAVSGKKPLATDILSWTLKLVGIT